MRYILLIISFLFCLPIYSEVSYSRELEEIFSKLDEMILRREEYRGMKEERIRMLQKQFNNQVSIEESFYVNKLFYEEYYVYNADSAMAYADKNLDIALQLIRMDWEYVWNIN